LIYSIFIGFIEISIQHICKSNTTTTIKYCNSLSSDLQSPIETSHYDS